ncbi:hypothetical protein [Vibrio fortis]|uniref:hypothetical protein n=1 Tax=Vibrio fortis TaxID=212667 RepID=UPI0038CD15BB
MCYKTNNSMFEGRGRPQRYGEPSGTTSVRLPKTDIEKLNRLRHKGFDLSQHLHNVINRKS